MCDDGYSEVAVHQGGAWRCQQPEQLISVEPECGPAHASGGRPNDGGLELGDGIHLGPRPPKLGVCARISDLKVQAPRRLPGSAGLRHPSFTWQRHGTQQCVVDGCCVCEVEASGVRLVDKDQPPSRWRQGGEEGGGGRVAEEHSVLVGGGGGGDGGRRWPRHGRRRRRRAAGCWVCGGIGNSSGRRPHWTHRRHGPWQVLWCCVVAVVTGHGVPSLPTPSPCRKVTVSRWTPGSVWVLMEVPVCHSPRAVSE